MNGKPPEAISESERWVKGYERICESAARLPDMRCGYVGDRESDMLALMRCATALDNPADWPMLVKLGLGVLIEKRITGRLMSWPVTTCPQVCHGQRGELR